MTLLEFFDRWMARRAELPVKPARDIRQLIGFAFLAGYYVIVYRFLVAPIPAANVGLVRDAMLTLGPPVGLIVGAMFRSNARDDQQAVNTAEAFRTIRQVSGPVAHTVTVDNPPENPVPVAATAAPEGESS
jgi:hypothetical protein